MLNPNKLDYRAIERLKQLYDFTEGQEEEIEAFLRAHPELGPILEEGKKEIDWIFGHEFILPPLKK